MIVRRKDGTTYDLDVDRWMRTGKREERSRGVGDTIERVIKTATLGKVKPCGGCRKRRDLLNRLVPYKQKGPDRG